MARKLLLSQAACGSGGSATCEVTEPEAIYGGLTEAVLQIAPTVR